MSFNYQTILGLSSVYADIIETNQLSTTNLTSINTTTTNIEVVGTIKLDSITGANVLASTGAGNIVGIPYSSTGGYNNIVSRDGNGNTQANNFQNGTTSNVCSGTYQLTAASTRNQLYVSGSGSCTVKLPDSTTLIVGNTFEFNMNSFGILTIQDYSGGVIATVPSGGYVVVILQTQLSNYGLWDKHFLLPANSNAGTAGIAITGNISASGTGTIAQTLYAGNLSTTGALNVSSTGYIGGILQTGGLVTSGIYTVNNSMSISSINAIIANSSTDKVLFAPGTYTFGTPLIVQRSNIIIDGQKGATFTLSTNANCPQFLAGDYTNNPPTTQYSNITVKNMNFNGNNSNQSSEFWATAAWIPNSCVSVTYMNNFTLENCSLTYARSAALTLVNLCNNSVILNCNASYNYFDAYTFYGATNTNIQSCYATNHSNGAGASFDNQNQYTNISNCNFVGNKLAIFGRFTNDLVISGCNFSGNTQQGLFLSGYGVVGADQGNNRWVITGNTINNNGSQGLYLQSCKYFSICGNTFYGNGGNGINIVNDTSGHYDGSVSYTNITGNTICNNVGGGTVGIYVDSSNSTANGAVSNFITMNIVKGNSAGQVVGDLSSVTLDDDSALNTVTVNCTNANITNGTISTANAPIVNSNLITLTQIGGTPPLVLNNLGGKTNILASTGATGTTQMILPPTNGVNGYFLQTDGTGTTSWANPPSAITTIYPTSQLGDSSAYVSFPYSYTSGSNVTVLQSSMVFPAGYNYRINSQWGLSITNTSGLTQTYAGYVTDGTHTWSFTSLALLPATTGQMTCTGISYYTTFTNTTATISLVFGSTGNCTLNSQSSIGGLPQNCSFLINNAIF